MPAPSSALSTLRPDLASFEEFNLAMDRAGFIGHRVLPVMEVAKQSGTFGKITIESLLQARTTRRAPGTGYNRGTWDFTTDTFATEEHGVEEPIDDNEAAMYEEYFDMEQVAAMRAFDGVLREAEKRIADAVFNATTFASYTTSITNEWDDADNAVPLTDVETAVQTIWDNTGIWPNALIINRKVFRNLRNVDQVVERIESSGAGSPTKPTDITAQMLAQCFDLDYILVAGSAKNTANEGQDASISPIWSDEYAMVCKIATSNDIREPCLGRTFHWGADGSSVGGTVETYRDETIRSDVVRVRHQVQEKILYAAAGYLLSNITT